MRTSLIIRDDILKEAMGATGVREKTALVHLGLQELINKAARVRLMNLGGKMSRAQAPRRRRQK